MLDLNEYKKIIEEIIDIPEEDVQYRNTRAAGVISDLLVQCNCGEPVVVGGLSVELYTNASYMTQDIDMIGDVNSQFFEAIKELGFVKPDARHYEHEKAKILVEFPSGELEGEKERIHRITTIDGYNLSFIGIEDILIDRIRARSAWSEKKQFKWISDMYLKHKENIDMKYIESKLIDDEKELFFGTIVNILEEADLEKRRSLLFLNSLDYKESERHNESTEKPIHFSIEIDEKDGWNHWVLFNGPKSYPNPTPLSPGDEDPRSWFAISLYPSLNVASASIDADLIDYYADDPIVGLTLEDVEEILNEYERIDLSVGKNTVNNYKGILGILKEILDVEVE